MVVTTFPLTIPKDSPFGLYNLPFGIFSTQPGLGLESRPRAGVAIGESVLDLHQLARRGVLQAESEVSKSLEDVFLEPVLNEFAALPADERSKLRSAIIENLSSSESPLFTDPELNENAFIPIKDVRMHLPMKITDYTDSFSSLVHAENCLHPLGLELPVAFTEYPMGYNGRLSSITTSGADVVRPCGFYPADGQSRPTFQPTRQLDFEIELGAFLSKPVEFGTTVDAKTAAADHIFGYVLLNDWSARDIQKYEMPPLGPFHSKGFITTISPWIVTPEALESSKAASPRSNTTQIHPKLFSDENNHGVYDIDLRASVARGGNAAVDIARSNLRDSYWGIPQMIAYQSSSGLGLHNGDLVAGGTISSPPPPNSIESETGSWAPNGCLLEAFARKHVLPDVGGRTMSWLEDGDRFTIEGWFQTKDGGRSGFGGVTSLVLPAKSSWAK